MPRLTYRLTILGCRVNHAEARDLESVLRSRGLVPADDARPADLEVVHTCSVTNTAAAKSRHAIRKAGRRLRNGPQSIAPGLDAARGGMSHDTASFRSRSPHVVVTGCFVSTNPADAADLAHRDATVPQTSEDDTAMIERFAVCLDDWLDRPNRPHTAIRRRAADSSAGAAIQGRKSILPLPVVPPAPEAGRHVRAELRIQDGCDAHCTFCIIPSIRKTLRSKTIHDAVSEARWLVGLGHREIVLTGIFIGAYGHETALRRHQRHPGADQLADLLDAVAQIPGLERLRISSMEPGDVTEPLLDAMIANAPVVVPHLHLPLQSGSDAILRRMNRQYRVGDYLEMIDRVNAALITEDGLPPAITTDIICGFPGESDADFRHTVDVARRVGYLHMHVFPYSSRTGTAAARWRRQHLPPHVVKRRVRTLIDLENDPADGLSISFRRRLERRTVRVILEQQDKTDPAYMTGRCDHYALIHVPTNSPRGTLVNVKISDVRPDRTIGQPSAANVALTVLR